MPSPLTQIISLVFALILSVIGVVLASIALQKTNTSSQIASSSQAAGAGNSGLVTQNTEGDSLVTTETARSIIFAQRLINLQPDTPAAATKPDEVGRFDSEGKFAVNVSGPQAWAHVQSSDEKYPHLRLANDIHNFSDLTTNADGVLEIKTVAGAINVDNHQVQSSVWPFVTEMDQSVATDNDVEFNSVTLGNSSSLLSVDSVGGLALKSAQSYILLNNVNVSTSALQNVRTMDQPVSATSDVSFHSATLGDPVGGHIVTLTVNNSNYLCLNGTPLSSSAATTTDEVEEGKYNQYFTSPRAQSAISSADPITKTNGTIGLNYNAANLKLTNSAIDTTQNIATTSSPTFAGLVISSLTGVLKATNGTVSAVTLNTTDISEGNNLYLTNSRVRAALSAGPGILYDPSTGIITSTNGSGDVTSAALSSASDTNVTITLGGNYSSALLAAASITMGWTGQLSATRGGTGVGSYILGDLLYSSAANTLSTLPGNYTTTKKYLTQSGTGVISSAPTWSTIAASELTGTSLPATIVSSSLTSAGIMTNLTLNRHMIINSNQSGTDQNIFYVDDGQYGTYTGSRFGTTNNDSGYANKQDVLSYTRTGISNGTNGGPGYSILGLRPPIDRYQNDGLICPRESTLTASRCFFNGSIGDSAQGEGMDLFNNKYPEYPLGNGINYGIALTKTGTDSLFREFSINFRCPTSTWPIENSTSVFRILPYTNPNQTDPYKMSYAKVRFEASHLEIVGNPMNFLSDSYTTQTIASISTVTHYLSLSSANTDLYTGMIVTFNAPTTEPRANVCNNPTVGLQTGTGTISVVAGSAIVTGTTTQFLSQTYFKVGAVITFGQYAYTVLSIQSETSLTLTENVFANGTMSIQKWHFAYPSTHATYSGKVANNGEYFVIVINSSTIQLATTYDFAMKGTYIRFSTAGAGTLSISYARHTAIRASSNLAANTSFTLPSNVPVSNGILSTDSTGNTTWSTVSGTSGQVNVNVNAGSFVLSLPQSIETTSSPTFAGLTINNCSGMLKTASGLVSGSATTSDLPEGSNLYFTTMRARSSISAGSNITYDSLTGMISIPGTLVNSIYGTANQILVSDHYGSIVLSLPQDISLLSSPTFAGLKIDNLTGVLKASGGVVAGSATTSDVSEGTNLYFTSSRARSSIFAGANVVYDSSSGIIDTVASPTFSGLVIENLTGVLKASGGVIAGSATTSDVSEGTNLYFTLSRARSSISAGANISYESGVIGVVPSPTFSGLVIENLTGVLKASGGVVSGSASTSDVSEGTNLYFTLSRARSSISAGANIVYDSSSGIIDTVASPTFSGLVIENLTGVLKASGGVIAGSASTSELPEGSNLYFTTSRARSSITAGANISYESGVMGVVPSPTFSGLVIENLTGVLKASGGVISGSATTSDVSEGTNLYYTSERSRSAISAGLNVSYDSTTGVVSVPGTIVSALTGSAKQVFVSNSTGNVTLSLPQDIDTTSSPTFAGATLDTLTLGTLSGVLKSVSGVVSGSATTTDLTEGSNLYFTDGRARTAISVGSGLAYDNSTGIISSNLSGTENQVNLSTGGGLITLSLPQNMHTTATPQFSSMGIGSAAVDGCGLNISVPTASATNYGLYLFNASAYTRSNDVGLWLNNTFTPSTTGASITSSKCTPTFNTSSGVVITKATGFDSSPSFNAGIGSSTYTDSYGMSTNPVLTVTSTSPLTVGSLRCCYMNPTVTMSGAAHVLTNLYGLYLGTGFTTVLNSSSVTNAYGIFINGLIGASTNYGLYISGGFLRNNDNALRIASSFTPVSNAAALYAARITPTFTSSVGLTHTGAYGFDITPNFNSSTTGTYTTVYGQNISPVINATGVTAVTISALRGLSITPSVNMSNAAHVLTNLNGIYVDVPSTTLGTGSITNSYGAYINVSSVATTNYGMLITGNFTKSSDLAFKLGSNITPASSAATLYQTRLQGQFVSSPGLTHSNAYGIDVNPTFVSTGTGTFTTLHCQNISPVVNASGVSPILIVTLKGINVTPTLNLSNAAHTLGNYYGIYVDSGTVNLGTGSITNAYGGYFKTPSGTNTSALYADTISCGNGGVTVPSSTILYVSPTIPKTTAGTLAAIRIAGGTCSVTQNTTSEMAMVFANATLSVSGTGTGTSVASYIGKCNSSVQVGGTITQMADFIAKGTLTYTAGTLSGAYGYYSQQTLVGTTAIPVYAGFYADAPVVSSGSVFYAYGAYFKNPATGTLRSALYTDDLNVGVSPVAAPTLGDLRCVTAYARNYRTSDTMFSSVRNNNLFECVKYTVTWSISSATSSVYMQRIGYVVTLTIASFTMNTSTSSACSTATGIVPACPATVKVGCPIIAYNGGYTSCIFSVNASGAIFIQSATAGNITPSNGLNIFPDSTLCQIVQYTMQPL